MSWFRSSPKYTVCQQCKVHFEPYSNLSLFNYLCPTCRKPVEETYNRKKAVINWAESNWEKLEPKYLKDKKKQDERLDNNFGSLTEYAERQRILSLNTLGQGSAAQQPYLGGYIRFR